MKYDLKRRLNGLEDLTKKTKPIVILSCLENDSVETRAAILQYHFQNNPTDKDARLYVWIRKFSSDAIKAREDGDAKTDS